MSSENGVIRTGSNLIQILFPTLKMMETKFLGIDNIDNSEGVQNTR